jgi:membrane protein HdeD
MSMTASERRRTGWDVVVGILLILGGFYIFGNVVLATALSIAVLGWTVLIVGVVLLVQSLMGIRSGGLWSAALGGAILVVLGLFILRNPAVGALSLTLLAGSLFLATGLTRIVASFQFPDERVLLIVSGITSLVLGLLVLFNLASATLSLLGVLLGVQTVLEGVTLLIAGRIRPLRSPSA